MTLGPVGKAFVRRAWILRLEYEFLVGGEPKELQISAQLYQQLCEEGMMAKTCFGLPIRVCVDLDGPEPRVMGTGIIPRGLLNG